MLHSQQCWQEVPSPALEYTPTQGRSHVDLAQYHCNTHTSPNFLFKSLYTNAQGDLELEKDSLNLLLIAQ